MKTKLYLVIIVLIVGLVSCTAIISVAVNNGSREIITGGGTITAPLPEPSLSSPSKSQIQDVHFKISFSGKLGVDRNQNPAGHWQIKFFEVSSNELDNSEFRTIEIKSLKFGNDCGRCVYLNALGKLNNLLGWVVKVDMCDQGTPGAGTDSIRIQVWAPNGTFVYDTATDFTHNADCEGHTLLDSGNLNMG